MLHNPLGVVLVRSMVPADVVEDCQIQADTAFVNEKLVFWAAAVLIVGMWVVLAYLSYLAVCDGL